MWMLVFIITELIAGLVQGVAGFGSGPIAMITFPMHWPLPVSAAISVGVAMALNVNMVWTYRRDVRWKEALLPIIPYLTICSAAISFSQMVQQALMKRILGAFLMALAIYYLFFHRREKKPFNWIKTALYVAVSAVSDAFFGIGGPLMVLYFLNKTDNIREYLGTIAAFFLINCIYNTAYRAACGILTAEHLPYIGIGMAAILLGVTLAHGLVKRLNDERLKKITYIMIGLSGLFHLCS